MSDENVEKVEISLVEDDSKHAEYLSKIDNEARRQFVLREYDEGRFSDISHIDFFLKQYFQGEFKLDQEGDKEKLQSLLSGIDGYPGLDERVETLVADVIQDSLKADSLYEEKTEDDDLSLKNIHKEMQKLDNRDRVDLLIADAQREVLRVKRDGIASEQKEAIKEYNELQEQYNEANGELNSLNKLRAELKAKEEDKKTIDNLKKKQEELQEFLQVRKELDALYLEEKNYTSFEEWQDKTIEITNKLQGRTETEEEFRAELDEVNQSLNGYNEKQIDDDIEKIGGELSKYNEDEITARKKELREKLKEIEPNSQSAAYNTLREERDKLPWYNPKRFKMSRLLKKMDTQGKKAKKQERKFNKQFEKVKKSIRLREEYAGMRWLSSKGLKKAGLWLRTRFGNPEKKMIKLMDRANTTQLDSVQMYIEEQRRDNQTSHLSALQERAKDKLNSFLDNLSDKVGERRTVLQEEYNSGEAKIISENPSEKRRTELNGEFHKNLADKKAKVIKKALKSLQDDPLFKLAVKQGVNVESLLETKVRDADFVKVIADKLPKDEKEAMLASVGWQIDEDGNVSKKNNETVAQNTQTPSAVNVAEGNEQAPSLETVEANSQEPLSEANSQGPSASHHKEADGNFVADENSGGLYKYDETANHYTLKPEELTDDDVRNLLGKVKDKGSLTVIAADFTPEELKKMQEISSKDFSEIKLMAQKEDGTKVTLDELLKAHQTQDNEVTISRTGSVNVVEQGATRQGATQEVPQPQANEAAPASKEQNTASEVNSTQQSASAPTSTQDYWKGVVPEADEDSAVGATAPVKEDTQKAPLDYWDTVETGDYNAYAEAAAKRKEATAGGVGVAEQPTVTKPDEDIASKIQAKRGVKERRKRKDKGKGKAPIRKLWPNGIPSNKSQSYGS